MAIAHRDLAGLLKKRGYTEIKKIGEGSFGKAILVQGKDGAKLVCKMIDVSKASAKEQKDALQEGLLLASLKHPYIVRYRENFTESGWLCIVMDYCEGGDLTKQVELAKRSRKPLAEEQILKWFTQAVLALKYIHDRHILHRDLKPSNFFLSKSGSMKMGDFGIAKVLSCTIACARTQIGTPYYLSPEVCGEKPYAWPSDIWALGCILYEMCALKVPFDAPNISSLVQRICRGPIPTVPSPYSEFIRGLVAEMLDRSPSKRPSTDEILKRPQIQNIVRQMLDEAQVVPEPGAAPGLVKAEPTAVPACVHAAPKVPVPVPAQGQQAPVAGSYRAQDLVDFYSSTHQDWLPATVMTADVGGRIIIDLKPHTWITVEEQATRVRPRRKVAPAPPAVAANRVVATPLRNEANRMAPERVQPPAMAQRSPSAGEILDRKARPQAPGGWPTPQPSPSAAVLGQAYCPPRGREAAVGRVSSCASSPRLSPSEGGSPVPGSRAPSPHAGIGGIYETPRPKPPGLPLAKARLESPRPAFRKNGAAGAVGAAILGA